MDRPRADTVKGMVENVDLESGTLTLFSGGQHRTFEIDSEKATVRVNGRLAKASELQQGQRASLRYILKVEAIGVSDRSRQGE